jgi:hypothetical protein
MVQWMKKDQILSRSRLDTSLLLIEFNLVTTSSS